MNEDKSQAAGGQVEDVVIPAPTFEDYAGAVEQTAAANPRWRLGQAAFNVLWEMRPDLSEQIRSTNFDPFYDVKKLPQFYDWVRARWDTNGRV